MRTQILICSGFILLLCSGFKPVGKKLPVAIAAEVIAKASAPAVPVLKGMTQNPFLKIMVSVPAGATTQQFNTLVCTLNNGAISNIEKLNVYQTGAEPFSAKNLIASVGTLSNSIQIPIQLDGKPGVYNLWLSVVLKNNASVNDKIEIRATKLINASGKQLLIEQGASVYSKYIGVAVRKAGDDDVNTYRIPGIATTDKGTLLSVYDIRYKNSSDLPGNIDVGLSRSTDGGNTWQPMKNIMDMGPPHENNGIGDPSILFDPVTKKIWVAALWSKGNRSIAGSLPGFSPDTTGQFVLVSSADDGVTWSAPYTITPSVKKAKWHLFFNGPGSGIAMQDGKLVFAAQYWDENKVPYSTIMYSDDHGATWKGKIDGPKSNTTESQVVETTPGTLMLNMRDNRGSFRSVATTSNMGDSWVEHSTSYNALQDPVCMASIIKAKVLVRGAMKEVLFFANPNTTSGRYKLTIKASLDLGETWLPANQLLIDERQSYGYSSLTKIDDNTIGFLYEGVKDLYFVKIPVNDIIK